MERVSKDGQQTWCSFPCFETRSSGALLSMRLVLVIRSDSERLEQAVEISFSAVPTSDFDPSRGITT
jgi:hypothetical protein